MASDNEVTEMGGHGMLLLNKNSFSFWKRGHTPRWSEATFGIGFPFQTFSRCIARRNDASLGFSRLWWKGAGGLGKGWD